MTNDKLKIPDFVNPKLLKQALTHRSAVNEKKGNRHNERLEFLGDAVLELLVSDHLFRKYPNKPEGDLTKLRTSLVRTETLAEVASELGIPDQIVMSRGERRAGGNARKSLLADTLEAVIGALYLDQGFTKAGEFIEEILLINHRERAQKALKLDSKSEFQELVQARGLPAPKYQVIKTTGPDHDRVFTAQVVVAGKVAGEGSGDSKRAAEQAAAKIALAS